MISEVSVDKLFGVFKHRIKLNLSENMTIIHGPNGFGKTVVLKMIDDLLNLEMNVFQKVPFSKFSITFNDSRKLWVDNLGEETYRIKGEIVTRKKLKITLEDISTKRYTYTPMDDLSKYSKNIRFYKETAEIEFLNRIEQLDLFDKYSESLSGEKEIGHTIRKTYTENKKFIKEFSTIKDKIKVHFIETQRLLNPRGRTISREIKHNIDAEDVKTTAWVVDNFSQELARTIQNRLAESASLTQSLDRSFPRRLVEQYKEEPSTYEEIQSLMSEIEKKRKRLIDAGILEEEKDDDIQEIRSLQKLEQLEGARNVLTVYISDVIKKLSFYDDLLIKIELLKEIIGSRFLYKKLSVNKEKGFEIIPTYGDNQKLRPSDLSSGEQHELVLLYRLLFKTTPNSLVMIDEPELSLHVGWQMEFLKDLSEITKLSNFQVLIATHSPEIIDDKWDLTVKLRGPENE